MSVSQGYYKTPFSSSSNMCSTYNDRPKSFEEAGIEVPSGSSGEITTTCPRCSPSRRKSRDRCLSVNINQGVWFCHHCQWKGCLRREGAYPRRSARRVRPGSAAPQPPQLSPDAEAKVRADADRDRRRMKEVWRQALPIAPNDVASLYLRNRGLWQTVPATLRFHPHLAYHYPKGDCRKPTLHAAIVAAVQGPDGRMVSAHRIYLNPDGSKAAHLPAVKKFMSPTKVVDGIAMPATMNGAACRLDRATDTLAVVEGLESGLAVRLSSGMPVWCALSANGMETIVIPESVRVVIIAGDHDRNGKGQGSAHKLCDRLLQEGRRVKVLVPEEPGDWADAIIAKEGANHV